jgi:hypothetical protein
MKQIRNKIFLLTVFVSNYRKTQLVLAGENMREENRTAEKDRVVFALPI